jgi:hypothetical protein
MYIYRGTNPFQKATEPEPRKSIRDDYVRRDYCDARKKNGEPCRQKTLYRRGRCKFHGGLSTGPKTEEGRQQSRINGAKGGRPRKTQVTEGGDKAQIGQYEIVLKMHSQSPQSTAHTDEMTLKLNELMRKVEALRR